MTPPIDPHTHTSERTCPFVNALRRRVVAAHRGRAKEELRRLRDADGDGALVSVVRNPRGARLALELILERDKPKSGW